MAEFGTARLLSTKEIQKQLKGSLTGPKNYLDLFFASFQEEESTRELLCLVSIYYKHVGLEPEWIAWICKKADSKIDHPWLKTILNYYWLTEAGQRFIRLIFMAGKKTPSGKDYLCLTNKEMVTKMIENAESIPLNLRHVISIILRPLKPEEYQSCALRFVDELCGAVISSPALGVPLFNDDTQDSTEASLEHPTELIRDFLSHVQNIDLTNFIAKVADEENIAYALQIIRANRGSISAKIKQEKEDVCLRRIEAFLLADTGKKDNLKYPAMLQRLTELAQPDNSWIPYKTKGRSSLSIRKDSSNGGLLTWRLSGCIDAPVLAVFRLLHGEANNFQFFQHHTLPELMHWRAVKKEADHEVWYYQFKLAFPLANREALLGVFDRFDPETNTATCVRFSVDDGVPLGSKFRRVLLKGSGILLEQGAHARETKMVMIVHVDPGGPIPKGLLNRFLGSTMLSYIEKIDEWIRSANASRLLRRISSGSARSVRASERPQGKRPSKGKQLRLPAGLWTAEVDGSSDEKALKCLMQAVADGMDINLADDVGWTALLNACQVGFEKTLDWLISREDILPDLATASGTTPLSYAVRTWSNSASQPRLVGKLISRGADPNLPDSRGETPLHLAALRGTLAVCRVLIEHGARQIPNKKGLTPLHFAVFRNDLEIAKFFLEAGGNPNAYCEALGTPLELARSQKFEALASVLEDRLSLIDASRPLLLK